MEKSIITFSANEQNLQKTGGIGCYASDTVSYIEAHFALGENWSGYDSIRAVWFNDYKTISTVLDSNGVCIVPHEVLVNRGKVMVNLVGSISVSDVLTDRLTSFPCEAVKVTAKAKTEGSETQPITPSQFEQYVAIVQALVGSVRDIDHIVLNDDYTLTIYYSDGTSDTTSSIRGATGNGIASIAKTGTSGSNPVVDTYTVTYTDGNTFAFTVTNGKKGDKGNKGETGNGIASIELTSTVGAVKTYTITFTDGTTTTFEVTDGEVTNASMKAYVDPQFADLKSDISDIVADEHSINLFDLGSPDIEENAWVYPTTGVITETNYRSVTPLIEVEVGKTYCYKVSSIYWTDEQRKTVWFYDESGNPISSITGTLSDGINTFTVPSGVGKYVRVTYDQSEASWMFIEGDEYPSDYVPYWSYTRLNPTIAIEQLPNEKSSVQNLYDKNAIDKSLNHYVSTTGLLVSESRFDVSGFIPVEYGKTYAFPVYPAFFGDSVAKQAIGFNKDKTFRATLDGVIADNVLTVEITNQFIAFIRVNIANGTVRSDIKSICQNPDVFMVTEAPYPTNGYVEYGNIENLKSNVSINGKERNSFNPLYGKTVVFAGDSICNGSSANDGKYGYAGRIGNKNNMMWLNAGISGGTFTANLSGSAGVISETNFFNSDYLIIEGGTNDADLIGNALSTHPAKFGTYDMSDFTSNYDSDTFCGAIEALFKRIVSDYKGKKIGVIIAQKMTRLNVVNTDYTKEHNNRRYYFETLMALCEKWGIPYLNLWDGCHLNPMIPSHYTDGESYMYTDGQHLASSGYDYIASIIEDWMKTL